MKPQAKDTGRTPARRSRAESKTARFLALVVERYGELAAIEPAKWAVSPLTWRLRSVSTRVPPVPLCGRASWPPGAVCHDASHRRGSHPACGPGRMRSLRLVGVHPDPSAARQPGASQPDPDPAAAAPGPRARDRRWSCGCAGAVSRHSAAAARSALRCRCGGRVVIGRPLIRCCWAGRSTGTGCGSRLRSTCSVMAPPRTGKTGWLARLDPALPGPGACRPRPSRTCSRSPRGSGRGDGPVWVFNPQRSAASRRTFGGIPLRWLRRSPRSRSAGRTGSRTRSA